MRESIHRSPPEQRRLDEAADDDRASARPHTAAAVLAAQSGAGNQAVARALAGRRTLSRWREFDGARGDAQYDYKIVNGNHATAGRYHIKFHNVESLGVFNEIHVVFENRNPMGYFFYSDAGVFIPGKSSTGLMYPELEAISRELVDEQLRTSEVVPDQLVQERRDEVAEQKLKDQAVKDQNLKQKEDEDKQYEIKQAQARELSKAAADESVHFENFVRDIGLLWGEIPRIKAYVEGTGPSQAYWKDAADWYKALRTNGWTVTLPSERLLKAKVPLAKDIQQSKGLPETVTITVSKTKSGPKHFNVSPVIVFPNYTTYVASKLGTKPPAVK